nr:COBRA-like protein 1 [Tanacetum cinerariifolium]
IKQVKLIVDAFLHNKNVAVRVVSNAIPLAQPYGAVEQNGNMTIKWDIISWTPDG